MTEKTKKQNPQFTWTEKKPSQAFFGRESNGFSKSITINECSRAQELAVTKKLWYSVKVAREKRFFA